MIFRSAFSGILLAVPSIGSIFWQPIKHVTDTTDQWLAVPSVGSIFWQHLTSGLMHFQLIPCSTLSRVYLLATCFCCPRNSGCPNLQYPQSGLSSGNYEQNMF